MSLWRVWAEPIIDYREAIPFSTDWAVPFPDGAAFLIYCGAFSHFLRKNARFSLDKFAEKVYDINGSMCRKEGAFCRNLERGNFI